jgi:hypothetical protein
VQFQNWEKVQMQGQIGELRAKLKQQEYDTHKLQKMYEKERRERQKLQKTLQYILQQMPRKGPSVQFQNLVRPGHYVPTGMSSNMKSSFSNDNSNILIYEQNDTIGTQPEPHNNKWQTFQNPPVGK